MPSQQERTKRCWRCCSQRARGGDGGAAASEHEEVMAMRGCSVLLLRDTRALALHDHFCLPWSRTATGASTGPSTLACDSPLYPP